MTDPIIDNATRPSCTSWCTWIYARSPAECFDQWDPELSGKWCVFRDEGGIDNAWSLVRLAVEEGRLPVAKVATRRSAVNHNGQYVICIYNRDWRDDGEIDGARTVLRDLGFAEVLLYKRDRESLLGIYGPNEWYRRT